MDKENHKGDRIAKVIARAGICSRRDAEKLIEQGRVTLNGEVLTSPAVNVTDDDTIYVDKTPLPKAEKTRLFIYHKPAGVVTTNKDERGRKTVFDQLPEGLPRVVTVGRLDLNTEGLLLLTNDGELSRYLELPSTGWIRRYRVRVHGEITQDNIKKLKDGITVDRIKYGSIDVQIDGKKEGANQWLFVSLAEGKNREIRRVMEAIGLEVTRLIRISYGPFQLGNLPRRAAKEIPYKIMTDQLADFFKAPKKASKSKKTASQAKRRNNKPKVGDHQKSKPYKKNKSADDTEHKKSSSHYKTDRKKTSPRQKSDHGSKKVSSGHKSKRDTRKT